MKPENRLPAELVQAIFEEYHPDTPFTDPPWVLGQICSFWRQVALSSSELWTTILVDLVTPDLNMELMQSKNDELLRRAQTAPLSVVIRASNDLCTPEELPLVTSLVAQCERWKSVDINFPSSFLLYFSSIRNRLPRLERLFVDLLEPHDHPVVYECDDAFNCAPALTTLHLACPPSYHMRFPWPQLQEYREIASPYDYILLGDLLERAPFLRSCTIREVVWAESKPLHHKHLTTLTIDSAMYFPDFTLPALTALSIISRIPHRTLQDLSRLIDQSGCVLTRLGLPQVMGGGPREDFMDLFRRTPALNHLCLTINHPTDRTSLSIVSLLPSEFESEAKLTSPLLPQLRSLEMIIARTPGMSRNAFDLDMVFDVIESRGFGLDAVPNPVIKDVVVLQHVALRFDAQLVIKNPKRPGRLEALQRKGLTIIRA